MFLCYSTLAIEEPQVALNYLRDALQIFDEQQQKNMAKQIEHIVNAIILNKESETFAVCLLFLMTLPVSLPIFMLLCLLK